VHVTRQMTVYTVLTVAVSLILWPVAHTTWVYPTVAAGLGVAFGVEAVRLMLRAQRGLQDAALQPMRLFHWSNSYLALVFVAAAVDPLLR
jgi:protoheme IX farnesyltransferase